MLKENEELIIPGSLEGLESVNIRRWGQRKTKVNPVGMRRENQASENEEVKWALQVIKRSCFRVADEHPKNCKTSGGAIKAGSGEVRCMMNLDGVNGKQGIWDCEHGDTPGVPDMGVTGCGLVDSNHLTGFQICPSNLRRSSI